MGGFSKSFKMISLCISVGGFANLSINSLITFSSTPMHLWNTNLTRLLTAILWLISTLSVVSSIHLVSLLGVATSYGYKLRSNLFVQHLLYMDDLKFYGKNKMEIDLRLRTVLIFSKEGCCNDNQPGKKCTAHHA